MNKSRWIRIGAMTQEEHEDHWKSFTDVFATICLVFFFVMVIFCVIAMFKTNEASLIGEENKRAQSELDRRIAEYMILTGAYEQLDQERAELEAEKVLQDRQLDELLAEVVYMQELGISNMYAAKTDFDSIALYRDEMYRKIESQLREVLGSDVSYDPEKGALDINTNFFFDKNKSDLQPEYYEVVDKIKYVLFEIIDEYTDPDADSLVRFEMFEFRGHTDLDGSNEVNRRLSTERANNMVLAILSDDAQAAKYGQYFIASGASKYIPKEGSVTYQTEAQMTANRRVEIIIRLDDKDIEKAISDVANALISSRIDVDLDDGPEGASQTAGPGETSGPSETNRPQATSTPGSGR